MTDTPETPKPLVSESGEYENLMELNEQNKKTKKKILMHSEVCSK